MFTSRTTPHHTSLDGKRIVVLIGGSGILGRALARKVPEDVYIVNVSRNSELEGANIYNHHFDINKNPMYLIAGLRAFLPHIEVLINLAYTKGFQSIEMFSSESFLKEINIDVAMPIEISKLCNEYFWSDIPREENISANRKVINISSLASFGKTIRPELATYSASKSALNIISSYLHDYLHQSSGVSAHVVAPGSLRDQQTLEETVQSIWKLVDASVGEYTITKIS